MTVKVQETLPGDWEILQESQTHTRESARVASWNVAVPAGGSAVLTYAVLTYAVLTYAVLTYTVLTYTMLT